MAGAPYLMGDNMKQKHTPGPWTVVIRAEIDGHGVQEPGGALVVRRGLGLEDARLIAAAPDLLAAAVELETSDQAARIVLVGEPGYDEWCAELSRLHLALRAAIAKAQP